MTTPVGTGFDFDRLGDEVRPILQAADLAGKLNQTGDQHRFIRMWQNRVLFVPGIGWLRYRDGIWRRDETNDLFDMTQMVIIELQRELDRQGADHPNPAQGTPERALQSAYRQHIASASSMRGRQAMLTGAETDTRVKVLATQLDGDPWVLRVTNGTLELKIGKRRDSKPEDYHTLQAAVAFDETATCPRFLALVQHALGGNAALVAYLQRVFGYALTGRATEQAFFFLYGVPNAGKSTVCEVLCLLLGDYGHVASEGLLYDQGQAHPTDIAELLGKRVVFNDELSRRRQLNTARLNRFTGSRALRGRFMRQDFFDVPVTFKLLVTANHRPAMGGTAVDGVWRRLKLLHLAHPFAGQRVKDYARVLVDEEGPGILNWALAGLRESFRLGGLAEPPQVAREADAYRQEEDVFGEFNALCLRQNPAASWVPNELVTDVYRWWCVANGHQPESGEQLAKNLRDAGYIRARPLKAQYVNADGGVGAKKTMRGWLWLELTDEMPRAGTWQPLGTPQAL